MFTTKWYISEFAPLVKKAANLGVNVDSPTRFLIWVNANKERAARHAGIQHFINEANDWGEIVKECLEMECV